MTPATMSRGPPAARPQRQIWVGRPWSHLLGGILAAGFMARLVPRSGHPAQSAGRMRHLLADDQQGDTEGQGSDSQEVTFGPEDPPRRDLEVGTLSSRNAPADADQGDGSKQQEVEVGRLSYPESSVLQLLEQFGSSVPPAMVVDLVMAGPQEAEGRHRTHEQAAGS